MSRGRQCSRQTVPGGMQIRDVRTGDNTGSVPGVMPSRYHAASHELASVDGSILKSWLLLKQGSQPGSHRLLLLKLIRPHRATSSS
jgi:hypothetical protein